MIISPDKKVDVLIAVLASRMSQIEHIRKRSIALLLWMAALFLFSFGFLISDNIVLNGWQKSGFTLILITTICMIVLQVSLLHKGFHDHVDILVKTEETLGLYTKGIYSEEAVLPLHWKNPGYTSEFFRFIYIAIGFLALLLLSLVWLSELWVGLPLFQ